MSDTAARLVVRQGPYPNEEYVLTQAVTVLGRGPNNDIVFADPEISRQHTQIIREDEGEYIIKDLGSTNGSFVNGRRVAGSAPLHHGDTINLGESIVLTFYMPGGTFYDDDETPTAEVMIQPAPPTAFSTASPAPLPTPLSTKSSPYSCRNNSLVLSPEQ